MPPVLCRKRLIPLESVLLKNDRILYRDSDMLITAWKTIRPKNDLASGYSCYMLKDGFKISRFYNHAGQFMFWYCDIIDTEYDAASDTYTFTDLLADVEVYPDRTYHILDLDELSLAFSTGLLTKERMILALNRLHSLLSAIYENRFDQLTQLLLEKEAEDVRQQAGVQ